MATPPGPDERHDREPAHALPTFSVRRSAHVGHALRTELTRELPLLRIYGLTIRRFALVGGALSAMTVPFLVGLPTTASLADPTLEETWSTLMFAKFAAVALAAVFVAWRMALRHGAARGTGYMVSVWMAAFGFGILAARTHPNWGALMFDAGIAGIFLCLATDGRLRRRHAPH